MKEARSEASVGNYNHQVMLCTNAVDACRAKVGDVYYSTSCMCEGRRSRQRYDICMF